MRKKPASPPRKPALGAASWLALVAATTLGAVHADTVRAEIKLHPEAELSRRPHRLIVQSYPASASGNAQTLPSATLRPLGSVQRAVTAADLARGVKVDLFEIADVAGFSGERGVVVAWVEPGEPDLEFDARRARPLPGSMYGIVSSQGEMTGRVEIRLGRS